MRTRHDTIRVAIVGGGCAAITTALELTRPEHAGRYEVTVYQLGWRLGGKGASGRGVAGRIEEHGLHIWMGWYENAFRMLRECYDELGLDWRAAFQPASSIAVADRLPDGRWIPWLRLFPPADGLPGDPIPPGARPWTVQSYLARTVSLLRALLGELGGVSAPSASSSILGEAVRHAELATFTALSHGASLLEQTVSTFAGASDNALLRALDALGNGAQGALELRSDIDPASRRIWHVLDLVIATLRGNLRAGLVTDPRGFDAIDGYDCREWLRMNGASPAALDSGYLRGLYDLGFGYVDGDPDRPAVSAGQALRGFLRAFFTYRGAFFWKMNAGMGDVVFAPAYEVLRRRGVRFEFFHRLTGVRLGPDGAEAPHVASLDFDVQAHIVGNRPYEPLVDVGGLPCWPSQPRWEQLEDGTQHAREGRRYECHWDRRRVGAKGLRVGRDFDFVVLGVGLGAIPHVAGELVARDARWRDMIAHVKTVATQAFQLWLRPTTEALGWPGPPVTLSGFVKPFDTWADMRHLLPMEQWPEPPGALAYFCSSLRDLEDADLADPAYPDRARARVRDSAIRFLERDVRHLWPNAVGPDGVFRWEQVMSPNGAGHPFDSQYWTANVNPSDRYVLSVPGSARHRISPLDPTYDNLTICGDWTDCGFNSGCVEAAVISGRLAAHALSRRPALEEIVGFDHP